MSTLFSSVWRAWDALSDNDRQDLSIGALAAWGFVVHYFSFCVLQPFFIEDAGISFAFATNWIDGHGFVPYVGGERVEGFSNPLWTFLIAAFYALGVPVWTSAKALGAALGLMCMPLAYALVRRALVDDHRRARNHALLSTFLLAASPQFVVWCAAGLENPLFSFLMLFGLLRVLQEGEKPGRLPVSALAFAGLALTRPEGAIYGVVGLLTRFMLAVRDRRFTALVPWLALFVAPVAAYALWRQHYFGWELPNTYYAKLGGDPHFLPFEWKRQGWKYIRGFWNEYWMWWTLPVLGAALAGFDRRAQGFIGGTLAFLVFVILWEGDANATWIWATSKLPDLGLPTRFELNDSLKGLREHWVHVRVGTILVASVAFGAAVFSRDGWAARGGLWATFAASMFYIIYVGADWMDGYRWFNAVVLTLFPLLAIGLYEITGGLKDRWRWLALPLPVVCIVVGVFRTVLLANSPETAVRDVHRRVQYMQWVQERLDLDHVTLLDVDMGAHMMFTDWHIVDMAGLIDVPIARHRDYNRTFMREYLYEERRPDFAHVHGSWGKTTRIQSHAAFKRQYVQIPGYPIGGRSWHVGNHVRRNLLAEEHRRHPKAIEHFGSQVKLVGADVPAPGVPPGGRLFIESRWRGVRRDHDYQVYLFLTNGEQVSFSAMEPGYGWLPPTELRPNETLVMKHWVDVPADFEPGAVQLGALVVDHEDGRLLPAEIAPMDAPYPGAVLLYEGELVVSRDEAIRQRDQALATAMAADCDQKWPLFKNALRRIARDTAWREEHGPGVRRAEATCWLEKGGTEALVAAMQADADVARDAAADHAATLQAQALALQASGDIQGAYDTLLTVLALDPTRSADRRVAERLRSERLNIEATAE